VSRRVRGVGITPVINGCADEIGPFAKAVVADYLAAAGGGLNPAEALPDLEASLSDSVEAWMGADDGTPEKRAALIRVAAGAVVCLAIDELARGARASERIANRLDALGFLKWRAVRK
jgi:hypothetical protein